jgi:hypothetical protein
MNRLQRLWFHVTNKFKKPPEIPSYEEKRAILLSHRDKFQLTVFVETGTFLGDTVEFFRDKFHQVYSVELSEELADKAIRRFEGHSNVKIIQGDSGVVLAGLINNINKQGLFWLDGHYSSEFFLNGEYIRTARSEKDTPIEKELDMLLNADLQHVILIDDARLFVGMGDYPTVADIRRKVRASRHAYDIFVEKDIINIIPR